MCAPYCSRAPVLASQPKLEAQKAVFCWRTFHIYCCIFLHIFPFSPTLDQPIPLSLCASSRCCLLPPLAWGGCKQHFSSHAHASMCLASCFGEKLHQEIIACMEGSLSRRTPHKALNQPHQTLFMGCKLTFFPQLFKSLHTFDVKSFRSFT